jgi:hypothetical protein
VGGLVGGTGAVGVSIAGGLMGPALLVVVITIGAVLPAAPDRTLLLVVVVVVVMVLGILGV